MDLLSTAEFLGNVGEFFAAIAVIVTLVYLSIQFRQSNILARAHAYQARTDSNMALLLALLQREDGPQIANKMGGEDGFSPAEESVLHLILEATFIYFENSFFQRGISLIPEDQWQASIKSIRLFLGNQTIRTYWTQNRDRFSASFREEVDNTLHGLESA